MKYLWVILLIIVSGSFAHAQLTSGILDPSRVPSPTAWTVAGVVIPTNRTQCGATLSLGGDGPTNGATIRAAIAGCGAGHFVLLPAGSYPVDFIWFGTSLSGMVSNVTLRGAGANSTFLTLSGGTCNGEGSTGVCMLNADNNFSGGVNNLASWTGGYSKGTTSITLGSFSQGSIGNLHAPSGGNPGSLLILNQQDDVTSSDIFVCSSAGSNGDCSQQPFSGGYGQTQGAESQQVTVTSISGSTIGITPGLYAPNWNPAKSPIVWFSGAIPITGDGLESMSLDYSGVSGGTPAGIMICNGYGNWIKDVRGINSTGNVHKHVWLFQASHNTVRDSYFYGSNGSSESYGVDAGYNSSDNLVENNIFQHIATAEITEEAIGTVFSYNYSVDDFYWGNPAGGSANFQQEDQYHHLAGDAFTLYEGNEGIGHTDDDIHGTSFMNTTFRTFINGHDPALTSDNGTGQCTGIPPTGSSPCEKTQFTTGYYDFAGSRYMNVIGSVLGTASYHNTYLVYAHNTTDSTNGTNSNTSVFSLGFSGDGGTYFQMGFNIPTDPLVQSTIMLWGNYAACTGDASCGSVRFVNGEVPSGISPYGNPIPSSHTLPPSFIYSSKPAFFGSFSWPLCGPDITGGNIPNVGGFCNHNPAGNCYLNIMGGLTNGTSGVLSFDAYSPSGCNYGTGGGGGTPGISIAPTSFNFGNVTVGSAPACPTNCETFTVSNPGTATLSFSGISFVPNTGDYQFINNNCGSVGSVAPSGNCTIQIQFTPMTSGTKSAVISMNTNVSGSPQTIPITGVGGTVTLPAAPVITIIN